MAKNDENNGAIERAAIGAAIGAVVGTVILPGLGTASGAKLGAAAAAAAGGGGEGASLTDLA